MKNNFKRNLLIGFGASLLILIVSSAASFYSIRNLLNSADLVAHTNEVIAELNRLNTAVVDAETGQRGYLLSGNAEFLDPYRDARRRAEEAFVKVSSLTIDNSEQIQQLREIRNLIDERFFYLDTAVSLKRDGKSVTVDHLEKGRRLMTDLRETVRSMRQTELELLEVRTETMNRFASYTLPLIISAAMLALLITVSFYARVRSDYDARVILQQQLEEKDRQISRRIRIIQGISEEISRGKYDIRVDDQQKDELGSVAGSLNKMAESLQYSFGLLSEKEWLQKGLNQLNEVMIGEKDVHRLAGEITDFISNYTNSQAAAFYVVQNGSLHFTAGYAYEPSADRRMVNRGNGLAGQCVVSKKLLEIRDIQPDNIQISYALGGAKPSHVVALPLVDGYDIKGVIELGTLTSFGKKELDFLQAASPNIGIALSTAENRQRLQELLEETQNQAEELKTQHSELENLNSELEVQAEKLQASEEELKVQQEELRQANQELEERSRLLEERNQIISQRNIEIQTTADQLAQTTRYKSEFLANMSHELRTPLNSILLLSRLMSENPQKNLSEEQIEYAKVIQTSGHGLLSLIDEILDLSKIEAGKMTLEIQPVTIKNVVSDMSDLFRAVATEKKIEFRTTVDENAPAVFETDKMRLEQVLKNLISNAIKFTSKGFVELSVRPHPKERNMIEFAVTDTGIGIPKEKQGIVFEAFRQADGSTRRKFGGTGLGLSISRELIRLLGGDISVTSEVDRGSTFTITVPIARNAAPAETPKPIIQEAAAPPSTNGEPPKREAIKYISTTIPANIPDDRGEPVEGNKFILIVEDDIPFAKSLLDFTRKKGYKGLVAVRGDEGVELARQFVPLGILLDIQLPIKSGWEVMEELKSDPHTRHIPVHVMSSHSVKNESLMKGAIDFINKPFAYDQVQTIFEKIEYVLTHHPKKVLIVEENTRHAKALAYFLETFDINLQIDNGVGQAIKSLQSKDVDCVILDMGIPDQKAYDTLEAVKKTPGLENLPIIIFTGKSLSQVEEMRIKQYADSIVVKTAHSYKRIIDEVSLFLHLVEEKDQAGPVKPRKLGGLGEVLKGKKVLIADDDMRNIFSLTKALEKYEMEVIPAIDGKDAIAKLNEHPDVSVVLMDMMMPEMDGYESTSEIRKDRRFKDLPIIAVTAKAMVGDRVKCINAGASDYITKPVDIDQLFSLLRVWLYERA